MRWGRVGAAILLLLFIAHVFALQANAEHAAQRADNYVIPLDQRVYFKSGAGKLDHQGRAHTETFGQLFLPDGPGPFPSVVLAHDWYGAYRVQREWGERLRAWGYAALLVDSLDPRGAATGLSVSSRSRSADFLGAVRYLRSRDDIDGNKVAIIGWGQGGDAVLLASAFPKFTAAVAYYPNCIVLRQAPQMPLLILMGTREDEPTFLYGHMAVCRKLAAGDKVDLRVLENATHGFDYDRDDVPWAGAVLTYNPVATKASIRWVKKFLEQHLRMER